MPQGDITSTSLARNKVSGEDERKYFAYNISPAVLQAGRNTVAVEVHQDSGNSSDLSFDLVLYAIVSP
jgi:hypothetical protein